MAKYASFKSNGDLFQHGNLKKTLSEIKAIKEKNGVTVFAITDQQCIDLQDGEDASESGGVITIVMRDTYKGNRKNEQNKIAKKLFTDYRDDIGNSDADISTYKSNLKTYFISDVENPINAATNKAEVDTAVAAIDWSSVVVP